MYSILIRTINTLAIFLLSLCVFGQSTATSTLTPSNSQGVRRIGQSVGSYFYYSDYSGKVMSVTPYDPNNEFIDRRYEFNHPSFTNSAITQVVMTVTYYKQGNTYYPNAPSIAKVIAPYEPLNSNTSWTSPSQDVIDAINWGNVIFPDAMGTWNNGDIASQTNNYLLDITHFVSSDSKFTIGFSGVQDNLVITAISVAITYTVPTLSNNTICCSQSHVGAGSSSAITGSTPSGGTGSYTYSWESSTNGSTWTTVSGATSVNYTPPVNLPQTTYYRRKVTSGTQANTSTSVTVTVNAPATPTGVSLSAVSTTSLYMSWNASSGATSYNIYNCTSGALATTVNSPTTNYTFTGLTPGTTYQYKIVAVFSSLVSPFSSCSTAATLSPPPPPQAQISTIAGNGINSSVGDNGLAVSASIEACGDVIKDHMGNVYVASQNKIRKITPDGLITTIAGTGVSGYSGDNGPATLATFWSVVGMRFDSYGNLYFVDGDKSVVRKINTSGIITTVAGTGVEGFSGDGGLAINAQLNHPMGIVFDAVGNFYVADVANRRIRKINSSGIITTIAGNGTTIGYPSNNINALSAALSDPQFLACDEQGNIFISDGYVIEKVTPSGYLTRYAGSTFGDSGDGGPATSAQFEYISGLDFDSNGNLYVADQGRNKIRVISPSGIVNVFAGSGVGGFSGDGGLAIYAELSQPETIFIDENDNLFVRDCWNSRARVIYKNCYSELYTTTSNNKLCCDGCSSVKIGPAPLVGLNFSWSPSSSLDCSTCAQPNASPCNTSVPTSYVVTVTGPYCTTTQNTVTVSTKPYKGFSCCRINHSNADSDSNAEGSEINLFPNPSSSHMSITSGTAIESIKIVNLIGQIMYEKENINEDKFEIDVSEFQDGIYLAIVKAEGELKTRRFTVNK